MSIFTRKSRSFKISEIDPTYKVRYLGNVQTSMMRGDGCVDKPVRILWDNYIKNAPNGLEMKLTICAAGLKAQTKPQGLTEYRAHRISYCVAHPKYPKLFVWVYRHEGKKMKVELRCHAVLCKTEEKAKAMAVLLHDKLTLALSEFLREKTRSQNSRLTLQRTNSLPTNASKKLGYTGMPLRKKMLSTAQNFKPSSEKSVGAPKLNAISEDFEPDIIEEEEEEDSLDEEEEEEEGCSDGENEYEEENEDDIEIYREHEIRHRRRISKDDSQLANLIREARQQGQVPAIEIDQAIFDVEIGNDISELKNDEKVRFHLSHVDSEDECSSHGSESGFSEHESCGRETGSSGSGSWADSGIDNDYVSACSEESPKNNRKDSAVTAPVNNGHMYTEQEQSSSVCDPNRAELLPPPLQGQGQMNLVPSVV